MREEKGGWRRQLLHLISVGFGIANAINGARGGG